MVTDYKALAKQFGGIVEPPSEAGVPPPAKQEDLTAPVARPGP
jgi:hypothetical protein